MSPANKAYLDMKYDDRHPLGLTWAGLIEVQTAYDWDPGAYLAGVPASADPRRRGATVDRDDHAPWPTSSTWPSRACPRSPSSAGPPPPATTGTRSGSDWARRAALAVQGIDFYRSPQVPWT